MRWFLPLFATGVLMAQAQPAQSPSSSAARQADSPPPCRKDRPLEEYLAELKRSKKQRNKNPLPTGVCLGSLCAGKSGAPQPEKPPPTPPPQSRRGSRTGESSSKEKEQEPGKGEVQERDPMAAAQSVEVGDYYFSQKNYRAALSRYQEALAAKPDDSGILLRLGRTFEKLSNPSAAFQNYDASRIADPAGPSSEEARKGAERMRPETEKAGDNPAAISASNRAHIVPLCPASPAPAPR